MLTHQEYAEGLRAFADWVEAHPEVALVPFDHCVSCEDSRENLAAAARALGTCQKHYGTSVLTLRRSFGALPVGLVFWRNAVCERRVVDTIEVPEKVIPAHTEEVVEWDCHSILGGAEEPAAVEPVADEIPY